MQDTLQKSRLDHRTLECWDSLETALIDNRLISFRIDVPDDIYVIDYDGGDAPSDEFLEARVENLRSALRQSGSARVLDAARLSYEALVCSDTQDDTEQDRMLYRRKDRYDALLDDRTSLSIVEPLAFLDDIGAQGFTYIEPSPIIVLLHDPKAPAPVPLPYRASFRVDASLLQGTTAEWLLACDSEEQDVSLTCQVHERHKGIRSLTIVRRARTIDGMNSNIVYNHIRLTSQEHRAA